MNIVLIHLFHLAEFPCVQTINYTTLFKPPSIFECLLQIKRETNVYEYKYIANGNSIIRYFEDW